jgi:peptide/nickel transport system permease protein
MRTFLLQRAVSSVAGALALSILIFGLIRLVPGDAVTMWMGQEGSMRPEVQQTLRRMFGLADPAYVQYFRWLGDLVQGDLGFSFRSRQPVTPLIGQAVPITIQLAVMATFLSSVVAVSLGILSAVKRNPSLDVIARLLG